MAIGNYLTVSVVLFVAVFVGLVVYEKTVPNSEYLSQFSNEYKDWHSRGKQFAYKNQKNLFYVYEQLRETNANEKDHVIVLLHGFPTSSFDYIKLWRLLASKDSHVRSKYTGLLTFDFLGYGLSEKPLDYEYSIFDHADQVDALLSHLKITKITLIAHDMSDSVAQELLRRDNLDNQNYFTVDKCALLNGGIFTEIYKPLFMQGVLLKNNFISKLTAKHFNYFMFAPTFRKIFGSLITLSKAELYDFYLSIVYNNGNRVLPLTIQYMNDRLQYDQVWRDALNETQIPTAFIYGPADPINPKRAFIEKMQTDLPRVKLHVLSDLVGHYPQFEDPFTVFQIIQKFLIN